MEHSPHFIDEEIEAQIGEAQSHGARKYYLDSKPDPCDPKEPV